MIISCRLQRVFSCAVATSMLLGNTALAAESKKSFKDIPPGHYAYDAVEYLKERGMLTGYDDGTFRPENNVNRAEALKLIVTPILSDADAAKFTTTPFSDVAKNIWYLPFVEWSRTKKVIDGPPNSAAFHGDRTITKAEFFKMFFASREVDPQSFGDIKLPFSKDVSSTSDWFYPYIRYGIASSMTVSSKDGLYSPNRPLTRADIAIFLHRFFLYRLGQRTQALLSETEKELTKTIDALSSQNMTGAQYTSARALLMMRGAREIRPDEPVVKAVVKVTEGYRALVRAYAAAKEKQWDTVIKLSTDAWYLGDQAVKQSPSANALGKQLQEYAKSFADQARKEKKK